MRPIRSRVAWLDSANRSRVLLADNNPLMLRAVSRLLGNEFAIVGAVRDGETLIHEARRLNPQIVVMDISMPGLSGLEVLCALQWDDPGIGIVFLTCQEEPQLLAAAIAGGALGYVLKWSASRELIPAIRAALTGKLYISPALRAGP